MDLFEKKDVSPMLIGVESKAFDDPDYIYELKLDGERGISYLDSSGTELRNKRNLRMLPRFPELELLHRQIKKPCVLDGEYVVMKDGKPCFFEVQRRSMMSDPFRISLSAAKLPVSFAAFDILWLDGKQVTNLPLLERKSLLQRNVVESERLSISRYIAGKGIAFYRLAEERGLEGIVAKKSASRYYPGKRTHDWVKIKNLLDDDFVICGYIRKRQGITNLVLGQFHEGTLVYKGHVTMGITNDAFKVIQLCPVLSSPTLEAPDGHGNEQAVWLEPKLVCTVSFMERTSGGGMRQPQFKGLREDKKASECNTL